MHNEYSYDRTIHFVVSRILRLSCFSIIIYTQVGIAHCIRDVLGVQVCNNSLRVASEFPYPELINLIISNWIWNTCYVLHIKSKPLLSALLKCISVWRIENSVLNFNCEETYPHLRLWYCTLNTRTNIYLKVLQTLYLLSWWGATNHINFYYSKAYNCILLMDCFTGSKRREATEIRQL